MIEEKWDREIRYLGNLVGVDYLQRCVEPGWEILIYNLVSDLFKLGWDGEVQQVKEKFGGLRFYIGEETEAISKCVSAAEKLSFKICETCGKDGLPSSWGGWWIKTLCPKHGVEHYEMQKARKLDINK